MIQSSSVSKRVAVVTHTNLRRPLEWTEAAKASVHANLPEYAEHHVISCPNLPEFHTARVDSLSLAEYVTFVDDDDLVVNDSIRLCFEALEANPWAAVSFTDEQRFSEDKFEKPRIRGPIRNSSLAESPIECHHMAMVRTSMLRRDLMAKVLGGKVVSEWFCIASAALTHGAVHIPVIGYQWRQHTDGAHVLPPGSEFIRELGVYRRMLRTLPLSNKDFIPVYNRGI